MVQNTQRLVQRMGFNVLAIQKNCKKLQPYCNNKQQNKKEKKKAIDILSFCSWIFSGFF